MILFVLQIEGHVLKKGRELRIRDKESTLKAMASNKSVIRSVGT